MIYTVRVNTVRKQDPKGFGGCIFTAREIDSDTGVDLKADEFIIVNASHKVIKGIRVEIGQWWQVEAAPPETFTYSINGFLKKELQVKPRSALMLRPSGEHIIDFLSRDKVNFPGIGKGKAREMWDHFKNHEGGLCGVLDSGEVEKLCEVLTRESAERVITGWVLHGDTRTLQWLHKHGFDPDVGRQAMKVYGHDTMQRIEEDPYRLLAFMDSWKVVDQFAKEEFNIKDGSPVRLTGAIEEALHKVFSAGHTVATRSMVSSYLKELLGGEKKNPEWMELAIQAVSQGGSNGSFVLSDDDTFHPIGAYTMEMTVAQAIGKRLQKADNTVLLHQKKVDSVIREYESFQGFELNSEQRQSVRLANENRFAVVNGGAGVGKTTVLLAMCKIFDTAGVEVKQVALAGKAAKKMRQATGRDSSTIASFLRNTKPADLAVPTVLIVDEASMVDIISMFRLCDMLPEHVRILMVGDGGQLMPVDPGLVFHALVDNPLIPQRELKKTKRFSGAIAEAALAVRHGKWPDLSDDQTAAISLYPCKPGEVAYVATVLYKDDPENSQIISARRGGHAGTHGINAYCQSEITQNAEALKVWNEENDQWEWTKFQLGDQLLCTRNRWDIGIQNGSMGRLVQLENPPRPIHDGDGNYVGDAIAWILWDDGEERAVFKDLLGDLELGYCVTVHKAQGSEWPIVIFPLVRSRRTGLIDRTMIYTAITRARSKVYLIGDVAAFKEAVEGPELARQRHIGLPALLERFIAVESDFQVPKSHIVLIESTLRAHGPMGKTAIAQATGLDEVAVARRLAEMQRREMVQTTGKLVRSSKGRSEREWVVSGASSKPAEASEVLIHIM